MFRILFGAMLAALPAGAMMDLPPAEAFLFYAFLSIAGAIVLLLLVWAIAEGIASRRMQRRHPDFYRDRPEHPVTRDESTPPEEWPRP